MTAETHPLHLHPVHGRPRRRTLPLGPLAAIAVLAAPMLVFATTYTVGSNPHIIVVWRHLFIVAGSAFTAAIIAAGVVVASGSVRDPRVLWLAIGYTSLAAVFACHGLATPDTIHAGINAAVGTSAVLSMMSAAIFITLSLAPLPRSVIEWTSRHAVVIAVVYGAALVTYVGSVALDPTSFVASLPGEWVNEYGIAAKVVNAVAGILLTYAAYRYFVAYQLSRLPEQLVACTAIAFLAEAQVPMALGEPWTVPWWLYHALIFASCGLLVGGWGWEFVRSGKLSVLTESLLIHEGLTRMARGYPDALNSLNQQLEAHDPYTLGHTTRVAEIALGMAEALRLSPSKQRQVTLVAQLHDIGKLGTPHHILNNPGPLDDDEFAEMRTHTHRGGEIIASYPDLAMVSAAVRAHHERYDGQGYPDGIEGRMIPIEARLVAVADVYDALTSDRPYRAAWAPERALAHIVAESGHQFDPAMVGALQRHLANTGTLAAAA